MSGKLNSCSTCGHYNEGKGEACCDFCDPPLFEDWWTPIEKGGDDSVEGEEENCL